MCCINNAKKTKELHRRIKKGEVIFYKVYLPFKENHKYRLSSMWRSHQVFTYGLVHSDSSDNPQESRKTNERIINRGIHIYLLKSLANWYKNNSEIIIKVKVKPEDLLGCDNESAVFTKIEITEKEWNKAKKEYERKI